MAGIIGRRERPLTVQFKKPANRKVPPTHKRSSRVSASRRRQYSMVASASALVPPAAQKTIWIAAGVLAASVSSFKVSPKRSVVASRRATPVKASRVRNRQTNGMKMTAVAAQPPVKVNPTNPVGTSFYENTIMETRCIRSAEQAARLTEIMQTEGKTFEPVGYDISTSALWRKYHTIVGQYNRLVVYPGNFFHAIDIQNIPEKLAMAEVRLTQRFICQKVDQSGRSGRRTENQA